MKRILGLSSCLLMVMFGTATVAQQSDLLEIRIEQGIESALPIAIVPFDWNVTDTPSENVSEVIASDLSRSGRFVPMPAADLPSRPSTFNDVNFKDWRLLGMENLVVGQIQQTAPDRYTVEFRLIDVYQQKQIVGFRVPTSSADLRFTAHHISDIIYEAILKVKGAFATRIAYVTVEKLPPVEGKLRSKFKLQIADSDGYNARTILESNEPLLSPNWSPSGDRIAYVSFEEKNSAIYIQNVRSGKRDKVVSGDGINSAPAFSPDGTRLAVTRSLNGNPDIYVLHIATRRLQRMTTHSAIDTEAAWMPDGRNIVFTSDRGGGPQIYQVPADGGKAKRMTFGMGRYNARASVAPNGKSMAVVNRGDKGYRIALVDLSNNSFDLLTDARLDESPSFAPNGGMIIYATMGRRGTELAAVSVDGRVRQRLAIQTGEIREPAWGPLRQKR